MKEKVFLGILLSFFLTGASFAGEPLVLNLQDSIERALNYNLDVQIARIKVEKAKLELKKEKASFKPQANISAYPLQWKGEYSFLEYSPQAGFNASFSTLWGMNATLSVTQQKGEDDKIEGTLSFTITQKILPTPKLASPYLSLRKFLLNLDKEKIASEEEIEDIKLVVVTSFYKILKQQKEYELKKLFFEKAKENLSIVKDKLKRKMASKLDLMDAQIEFIKAQEELYQAESGLSQSMIDFKELLGIKPDEEVVLEDKSSIEDHFIKIKLEDAIKKALENNRQINQQKLTIKMRRFDLLTSKSEVSPSLNLLAGYNYNKQEQKQEEYRIGMYVEIPLLDGGRGETETQIAQKELEKEKLNLEKLKQKISGEIRENFYELKRLEKRLLFLKLSQEKQKEALNIAKKMFSQGALTSQEVREREVSLKQAEIDYLSALGDYEIVKAKLLKSIGEGI